MASTTTQSETANANVKVQLIHFNDVYHIEPNKKEPIGGASRFVSAVKSLRQENNGLPLVLFSGDVFNPSLESSVTKGDHMVPILNEIGVDCACYGNHDFDFGISVLSNLASQCSFPWLLSNVFLNPDGTEEKPLADAKEWHIIERFGLKIGIIGVVESEWLETCPSLPTSLIYKSFVTTSQTLAKLLREQHNCDLVIALTHNRLPNDRILSKECPDVDLILGGHDHFYEIVGGRAVSENHWEGNDIRIIKSGTDFRELSFIELEVVRNNEHSGRVQIKNVRVQRVPIMSSITPCPKTQELVSKASSMIASSMSRVIALSTVPLEARTSAVRLRESNFGNFVSDLVRLEYNTDIAFLCGGAIRGDDIYGPGEITIGDIMTNFPFEDPTVVLKIKGKDILAAIENGVSAVPHKTEGRFPQVGGMQFAYDSRLPVGQRVVEVWITSGDFPQMLDLEKVYTMATRHYLALGNDGYKSFLNGEYLFDPEQGALMSCLIRRFFLGAKYVNILKSLVTTNTNGKTNGRNGALLRAAAAFKDILTKRNAEKATTELSKANVVISPTSTTSSETPLSISSHSSNELTASGTLKPKHPLSRKPSLYKENVDGCLEGLAMYPKESIEKSSVPSPSPIPSVEPNVKKTGTSLSSENVACPSPTSEFKNDRLYLYAIDAEVEGRIVDVATEEASPLMN